MPSHPPAFPLSLDRLQRRYGLPDAATEGLSAFAALLAFDPLAPTTVTAPAAVRDDHIADALVALQLPEVSTARVIADIGAGAGVPGIPLAVTVPAATVNLIEGNGKKREFMRRAVAALGLDNAVIPDARAEIWHEGLGSCDVVTARALASLDVVAEYAAPLLRLGGILVAWRGRRDAEAEAAAARAAAILGLELQDPIRVEPYAGVDHRYLHVLRKVADTPERFPRRDGVARKRPLGSH
jgi:16S rRNA (guanine527-N7)-methyltransferase